jgi:hypothetical protein
LKNGVLSDPRGQPEFDTLAGQGENGSMNAPTWASYRYLVTHSLRP